MYIPLAPLLIEVAANNLVLQLDELGQIELLGNIVDIIANFFRTGKVFAPICGILILAQTRAQEKRRDGGVTWI